MSFHLGGESIEVGNTDGVLQSYNLPDGLGKPVFSERLVLDLLELFTEFP